MNRPVRSRTRTTVERFRAKPSAAALSAVFSALGKSVKAHLMHRNKAARIKQQLTAVLQPKGKKVVNPAKTEPKAPAAKVTKKSATKTAKVAKSK
jgi:ribosomal protein S20